VVLLWPPFFGRDEAALDPRAHACAEHPEQGTKCDAVVYGRVDPGHRSRPNCLLLSSEAKVPTIRGARAIVFRDMAGDGLFGTLAARADARSPPEYRRTRT
jgi:hypothetical protein